MIQQSVQKESKISTPRLFLFFIWPYRRRLTVQLSIAVFASILESLQIAVLYPVLSSSLDLDSVSVRLANNPFFVLLAKMAEIIPVESEFLSYCILFVLLTLLIFLTRLVYLNVAARTSMKISTETKSKVFRKYTQSDYQFFVDNRQGDLFFGAKGGAEAVTASVQSFNTAIIEIITFTTVLLLLFSISWKATIGVIFCGLVYWYVSRILARKVSYIAGQGMQTASKEENVVLNESLTGTKQIIAASMFPEWQKRFDDVVRTRYRFWIKNRVWSQIPPRLLNLLMYLSIAAIVMTIWIFYNDIWEYQMPLIGTYAFAVFRLLPHVVAGGTLLMGVMTFLPNLELIYELLEDKTYSKIINGTREFSRLRSGIELRNVSFAHKNKDDYIVNDASLRVDKNKLTALVGPSGAGKSTIVDLILRLYDLDKGVILIDGVDIKEYDIDSFRRKVGFVGQEAFIYNASVKDNIEFGTEYEREDLIEAAHCANAHEFIQQLEEGYDTIIGDRGIKLSGGERQRIAIARAIIRKPDILIMDEATSALDNISERIVQRAIDSVSESCTTLIIAHRLSTIRNADAIYVIDGGKIVESGTHKQLINKKGKYWELYSVQK